MRHTSDVKRGVPVGRPRGTTNKRTTAFNAALWEAFQALGGVPALAKWGREHPTEFYELCGQLLTEPGSSTPPLAVH
jgi:hypothetical protein